MPKLSVTAKLVNFRVMNDLTIDSVIENLAFFVSKINPMHQWSSPVNKTMHGN